MGSLFRIQALAANTFREAIRNKLLYTLLGFSILMIASGVLLATLSYVEVDEILQDMGMSAIRFFGAGIAIFVGIGLIHNEVDRRTIFTILSKPVSRSDFLLGKWAGLTFTVWLQLALMGVAFAIVSALAGAPSPMSARPFAKAIRSASTWRRTSSGRPLDGGNSLSVASAIRATRPEPLGGNSCTTLPRNVVDSGSTRSVACAARSSRLRTPPLARTHFTMASATAPS